MVVNLITFVCEHCGLKAHAHIGKKGKLTFSINDKLYSRDDVLSHLGYYVCIDCREKTNVRFKVFI